MPKRTFRVTNSFVKDKCSFILGNSLQIGVRVQASRRWVHDFPDWNSGKIYTFQRQIDLLMQIHRSRSVNVLITPVDSVNEIIPFREMYIRLTDVVCERNEI